MKTIMFYSYKGGSGRTVAAANVASALAKAGKKVAIIDLDFEAPGLHHVLGAEKTSQFKGGIGVQHYLKGEIVLHELFSDVVIDMFAGEGPLSMYDIPSDARLLYIMASPKVAQVNAQEPQVEMRMTKLLEMLQSKYEMDYVVLDAASGIRDAYSIAADVSNEMLVFFRWSTQHVEGTLRMVRYMKLLKDYDQTSIPFKLIASASPGAAELENLTDEKLRDKLVQIRENTQARMEQALAECEVSPAKIFHEIPEMIDLKWRETVIVFRPDITPYETLAQKLLESGDLDNL